MDIDYLRSTQTEILKIILSTRQKILSRKLLFLANYEIFNPWKF